MGIIVARLSQDLRLKVVDTLDTHARQAARVLRLTIMSPIEEPVREQCLCQPLRLKPFGDFFVKDLGEHVKLGTAVLGGTAEASPIINGAVRLSGVCDFACPSTIK